MVIGMGTVFIILTVILFFMMGLYRLDSLFTAKMPDKEDGEETAALTAALFAYRKRR